jgi:transcription termination/antitermination protein NusA
VPHLDGIVEDEQLSLAIGKRGQNVRLASELIGAKIDIKSETDVKDEVADALAKMLQTAISQTEGEAPAAFDLTTIPGVGGKTAEKLVEAGYGSLDALLSADLEALERVETVGPKTAAAILEWAAEQTGEQQGASGLDLRLREERSAPMDDSDFMAALSKAFKESEVLRTAAEVESGEEAAAADGDEAPEGGAAAPPEEGGE